MATQSYISTKTKVEVAERATVAVTTGPAVAAMISGGVGTLAIGLLTTGAEISAWLKEFLTWTDPVGPLSGKTGVGVIIWLVAWVLLYNVLKDKDSDLRKGFIITLVLITLGVIGTFPTFFEAFAH